MEDKSARLPTELWIQILSDLRDSGEDATRGDMHLPSTLIPWLSVSRRFQNIAELLLYEKISINIASTGFNKQSTSVLVALETKRKRAAFVKHLYLYGHECECEREREVATEDTDLSIDTTRLEAILPNFLCLKQITARFANLSSHLLTRLLRAPSAKSPMVERIVLIGSRIWGQSEFVLPQPLSNLTQLKLEVVKCNHPDRRTLTAIFYNEDEVPFADQCLIRFLQLIPKLEHLVIDPDYFKHLVLATKAQPSCLKSLRSFTATSRPGTLEFRSDIVPTLMHAPLIENLDLGTVGAMQAARQYFSKEPPTTPPQADIELPDIKFFRGLPYMASYILLSKTLDTLQLIVQPQYLTSAPANTGVARVRCLDISCTTWREGLLSALTTGLTGVEEVSIKHCECQEGPRTYDLIDYLLLFPDVRRFRMKICETGSKKRAPTSEAAQKRILAEASRIRPGLVELEIPFGGIWRRRNTQSGWYAQERRW